MSEESIAFEYVDPLGATVRLFRDQGVLTLAVRSADTDPTWARAQLRSLEAAASLADALGNPRPTNSIDDRRAALHVAWETLGQGASALDLIRTAEWILKGDDPTQLTYDGR